MIRRPPKSTQSRSSAASDVYKRQRLNRLRVQLHGAGVHTCPRSWSGLVGCRPLHQHQPPYEPAGAGRSFGSCLKGLSYRSRPVSYTHLRAHETVLDLVCRLLLEKKKKQQMHGPT
eukprot:TRINITY_DN30872_c0_g1_i1.p1 TRINITY_DN30872_c0_g1~~TRINITY_DN30872_c0_g1_i1.p1  ORF type:complete len:116 (+),score=39.10 TRINITY_DN30872_c0_g1_i1:74-421(+)